MMKKKILFIILFLIAVLFYGNLSYAYGPIGHLAQARDVIKRIQDKQLQGIPLTDIETCIVTNESAFKSGALDGDYFNFMPGYGELAEVSHKLWAIPGTPYLIQSLKRPRPGGANLEINYPER